MELFGKIGGAILLIAMLVYLVPRAKQAQENSPPAERGDWQAAIIPILIVIGFVAFLMSVV